jgi:hypothetical protein
MTDIAPPEEVTAWLDALDSTDAHAPSACDGWTAHDVRAHITAAWEEVAELIEAANLGAPTRPTKSFDEREPPFQRMDDAPLRELTIANLVRFGTAATEFAGRGPDASFDFTGQPFTLAKLDVHGRSECLIHRWDVVGDDEISERLLSQPHLTQHAVAILNTMSVLQECVATRAAGARLGGTTVVLRSPGHDDVVLAADSSGRATLTVTAQAGIPGKGVVVTTDAANRLLTLWGRRSRRHEVQVDGDPALWSTVEKALWPRAVGWPATR